MEEYRTIRRTAVGEYEEKKSRFIAAAARAATEAEALALTDGSYQLPLAEGTDCILVRQDEERDGQTYTTLTPQPDGSFTEDLWFLDERGIGVQVMIQSISE